MISYPYQCIFVHIPRTGGSSIERLLWPAKEDRNEKNLWMGFTDPYHNKYQTGGLQHLLASQIRREVGEETFRRFFKFAFVRNPWDKTVSQYLYMKRRKDLRAFIGMAEHDSFNHYLTLIAAKKHVQWEAQYRFIYSETGRQLVDFVGRFEHFRRDLQEVLERLGIRTRILGVPVKRIPHLNRSVRRPYREYYDCEARERVRDMYRRDIELFGYRF